MFLMNEVICSASPSARAVIPFVAAGEEQLHLAAHRRTEQAEGAPGAAAEKEEDPEHDDDGSQRPEKQQHTHPGNGESGWRGRNTYSFCV